jgi:hypothetical protein
MRKIEKTVGDLGKNNNNKNTKKKHAEIKIDMKRHK